jgi:molecular chaperone DnaJ
VEKLSNPYEVLGINQGASEEEIKKAYREMVKKYHPDQYQDNPLSTLAEEKLREINEAYESLTKNTNVNSNGYRGRGKGWGGFNNPGTSGGSEFFNQVKMHIKSGNIRAAEELLKNSNDRTAEWYYLNGLVFLRKGWYDEAYSSIQTAANMDPNNFEYRDALNRINTSNKTYRGNAFGRGYGGSPDLCTMCQCLWCSDICCECGGGDLVGCC